MTWGAMPISAMPQVAAVRRRSCKRLSSPATIDRSSFDLILENPEIGVMPVTVNT